MSFKSQFSSKEGFKESCGNKLSSGSSFAFSEKKDLLRLLENTLKQNNLLIEEKKTLWARIDFLGRKRSENRRKFIELLAHLTALFTRDRDGEALKDLLSFIGENLKLNRDSLWRLKAASSLYRLGLVYMPEELYQKKGLCFSTGAGPDLLHLPLLSAKLLAPLDGFSGLASLIADLGERYDGSGGPKGLKGRKILLESRILSAALAFRELVKEGRDDKEAVDILISEASWDPKVLAAISLYEAQYEKNLVRIPVWDLIPGMVLASPIYAEAGAMLLPKGSFITEEHLERLKIYSGAGPINEMVLVKREGQAEAVFLT